MGHDFIQTSGQGSKQVELSASKADRHTLDQYTAALRVDRDATRTMRRFGRPVLTRASTSEGAETSDALAQIARGSDDRVGA